MKYFKGYLRQILIGLFLNTLPHMMLALHIQLIHCVLQQTNADTPFSPTPFKEWNIQDFQLCNVGSFNKFRNILFKIGQATLNFIYGIRHFALLKLLTRFRLVLSHLNE